MANETNLQTEDPATYPCIHASDLTSDGGVHLRTIVEGTGPPIPKNAKIWLTVEGRKDSGEVFQRPSAFLYVIGYNSQRVISQGCVLAFAKMRVGDGVWVKLQKQYHLYADPGTIWLKLDVQFAMEDIVDKLPQSASVDDRVTFSERYITEANNAVAAKHFKDALTYYHRAIDSVRAHRSSTDDWTDSERLKLQATLIRCELNIAKTHLDFSQVREATPPVRTKRLKEALVHCAAVLQVDPRQPKALYRKAKACFLLDDLQPALIAISECLKQEPGNHQTAALQSAILARRNKEDARLQTRFRDVLSQYSESEST